MRRLLCVAHTLVEQMFSFMASSWDQWPRSNQLLKRAKRTIWSTGHSLRTRVLVGHICGHHEATPCLGQGWGVEAGLRMVMPKGILKCTDPGLLEIEPVTFHKWDDTHSPKPGNTVGHCLPRTFMNLFSLPGTHLCPS